ncbi:MAG: ABC transporter permease subunit [Alphaproteobacteria bacterium]|nr:ABC transporter permease subunit [Alphaproteobacteria bacterium]MCB9793496.1 ABC transporter permease subunit [Alphaproteobacteria bacterium]
MSGVLTVFKKELKVYFVSPLAYVFLGVFLFLAGLFFYLGIALTGEASLRVMLGNMAISLLFVLPMLTMRHFAEERRAGTFELLLTAPLSLPSLILGKWLASMALCLVMLAGTLLFPAILAYYGDPDWGVIATSYVGLVCVCGAFCAAGLFSSSLTDDQVAAGMGGIVLLMPFWLIGNAGSLVGEDAQEVLDQMALLPHLRSFTRGVIDSADIAYFLGFAFVFLFLTYRTLESRRWR